MIAHIVLFTPKESLGQSERLLFAQSVVDVVGSIPDVRQASVGKRVVVDAGYDRSFGDKTYQMAAVLYFDDRDSLVRYLRHPLHERLGKMFWESCASTVISEVELVDLALPGAALELAK